MKKHTRATFGILGLALFAGAAPASADVESSLGVTGELSAGWDSRYFFRGLWFGDDTAWANAEISKELSDNLTGSLNLFYTDVADTGLNYSEGNIGATLSYDAGFGTFDFGFLYYKFFDGFAGDDGTTYPAGNRDATELNITYSQEICQGFNFHVTGAYDLRIDGGYVEVGVSKSWQLSETVGLDFSVATGYSIDDYYSFDLSGDAADGHTHTLVSLALPVALSETATFTPHVSCNFSHEARDGTNAGADRDDAEVFWGASLGVSF